MNFAFITSMDKKYYDRCGELMLHSFRHKMKRYPLYVYNEDFAEKIGRNINMQGWPMDQDYHNFQKRWQSNRKITTFAKKAFSIIHALETIKADRIVWLDADTQVKEDMPLQLLEWMSPDHVLSTHLGVTHTKDNKDYFSCETGFFIVNKNHRLFDNFLRTYKNIYLNDDYKKLRRFYDGEVYGETVLRLENKGADMIELNPGQHHKTPIPRSVIGPYISHYKAGQKDKINLDELKKYNNEV